MERIDPHRPSAINPEEYQFVAFEHLKIEAFGDCSDVLANREIIRSHMAHTGGTYSNHEHGGNCMVCGAWAIYTILFYHPKTNSYVRTGGDCAQKMDLSCGDLNLFRKQVTDYRQARAGLHKAEATLNDLGLIRAWEIREEYLEASKTADLNPREFGYRWAAAATIDDITSKLIKYGSISEAQVAFLRKLVDRHDGFEARQQKIDAEREAAAPCPTGRVRVTGTVLGLKQVGTQFGVVTKMTVKAREGFVVWVTVPASLVADRGQEVSFTATLTPSNDDPKFGFGKRPVAA